MHDTVNKPEEKMNLAYFMSLKKKNTSNKKNDWVTYYDNIVYKNDIFSIEFQLVFFKSLKFINIKV